MTQRAARLPAAILLCALLCVAAACGPKPPKSLQAGERGQVIKISPDGRLVLADGLIVRLAAVDFPPVAAAPEPVAAAGAKSPKPKPPLYRVMLIDGAMGRPVRLYYDGRRRDARGAALAQVFAKTEAGAWIWLQEDLLRAGAARVRTTPNDRAAAKDLLAAELQARKAKAGLWAEPRFAVRAADPLALAGDLGTFATVEGEVQSAAKSPGRIFLNFGPDYRTDFTASIPEDAWTAWPGGAADLMELTGARVRVRGVIEARNGPSIEVTHPEQIELPPAKSAQ